MFKLGKDILLQNGLLSRQFKLHKMHNLFTKQSYSSYEGDGKTKVKVLNNDPEMGLMVNSFSEVSGLKID